MRSNAQEATVPDEHTNESNESTGQSGQQSAPPWGDDFDPARAWALVQNLRGDNAKVKEKLTAFEKAQQEREDAEKSAAQKAIERAERAEKALAERTAADERSKAMKDALKAHGLDEDDAELLDGVPADKLDARAEALAKRLGKSKKDTEDESPAPVRPKAKLKPGHVSLDSEAFDVDAFVEGLRKNPY